jgi:signal peptide peptidase SppA
MMLEYLMRQLSEPCLIEPSSLVAIRSLFESKYLTGEFMREGKDPCGKAVQLEGMRVTDGIAQIPMSGVIGQKLNGFAKGAGAVDVADIAQEIDMAMADKSVLSVLFDIDSPGGMAMGTPELASKIKSITKPKYAFTNGMIASAAYYAACACDAIFATPSAMLGSIGSVLAVEDTSERAKAMGVKVEVFRSGDLKGIGIPGTSLSEVQRTFLLERVMNINQMFIDAVRQNRGAHISDDTMRGQSFLAREALNRGLIDGIVSGKADVIAMMPRNPSK